MKRDVLELVGLLLIFLGGMGMDSDCLIVPVLIAVLGALLIRKCK